MKSLHKIITLAFIIQMLSTSVLLQAQQNSNIQHIRQIYKEVKDRIAFAKENKFEGGIYCNILEENITNKAWINNKTSHSTKEFWYEGSLSNEELEENPKSALLMVIEKATISKQKIYSEYLYEKGELIFAFYKGKAQELRFYYKNGKLIKQLGKSQQSNSALELINDNAKKYQNILLAFSGL